MCDIKDQAQPGWIPYKLGSVADLMTLLRSSEIEPMRAATD